MYTLSSSSAALRDLAVDGKVLAFYTEADADRAALAMIDHSVVSGLAVYVYDARASYVRDGGDNFVIGVALVAGLPCVGRWTSSGYRSYRSQSVFVRVS